MKTFRLDFCGSYSGGILSTSGALQILTVCKEEKNEAHMHLFDGCFAVRAKRNFFNSF